jgi:hypothetical protein
LLKVFVAQSLEQFSSGYSGHFIINSRPLWAPPLGTKENKIPKLGGYISHILLFYARDSGLTNLFMAAGMLSSPLFFPWIILWSRLESHPCPLPHTSPEKKFWASKPVSRVLYSIRSGDHPSSPDVTIRVKRPTRGPWPSTLNLPQSFETLE